MIHTRRDFLAAAARAGIAVPAIDALLHHRDDAGSLAEYLLPARQQPGAAGYSGLRWRMLGPFRGGRVDAVTGVPGRPNEFYFGAVNGGVWKSVDAGRVWTPVFDGQPVASIGAIAVAPSAPDTVYVGTGESTLRDSTGFGNGVYKSTDAGRTWNHLGLDGTQHIGRIAVDPKNPNIAFVAAIGPLYAASPNRGLFRTTDGGKTWTRVLSKDDNIGAVEVVIDPTNSRVVYAGLWNTRRPPWYTYAPTNGPGGGIFKSTDGGTTWTQLTNGLPKEGIGKTAIGISASNPKRLYAVVDCLLPEAVSPTAAPDTTAGRGGRGGRGGGGQGAGSGPAQGGFFRSDDAGSTWHKVSSDQSLSGRGWYFEHVAVDPRNADIVYVPNVAVNRSKDGGKTWVAMRGSPGGDDYHQAWVSPDDPNTVIVASDQGAIITRNAQTDDATEITWSSWLNQPTAQIYRVSVDYRDPYWVIGAQQDSGGVAVCSRGQFAEISMRDWEPIGAIGESGDAAGDPLHPGIIFGGRGSRFDIALNTSAPSTAAPGGRSDWTQPLVVSPADPRALYCASEILYKSTDTAQSWTAISTDLTRADPGIPANLDTAAAAQVDRNGKRGVIYAIAPSPIVVPMVWVGTDDGLIHVSTNDGKLWQNVTPPAMTAWSRVTMIEASHFDFNSAYASVDRHQLQDFEPYIYRTRDLGKSWQKITDGLPTGVYVHCVKEDPKRPGLLFAGTERGAFLSFDDGDSWQSLQLNLPVTSVRDFEIYKNDLIVGTHGRGFWVIDDISSLRQLTDAVLKSDAHLFKPADATLYIAGSDNGTPLQKDEPQAQNPTEGAYIDYYLRTNATGTITLEVLDASGATVRTFAPPPPPAPQPAARSNQIPRNSPLWTTPAEPFSPAAGMHRVVFNPGGGGGRGGGGRGGRGGGGAPAQTTGMFTARLTVNGKSDTQTFNIKADPRSR